MKISSITAEMTYALRQQILRPDFSIAACKFPEDDEITSAHFGSYISDDLVGIVSIINVPETNSGKGSVLNATQWQIRAMATHESVRGKGYAAQLLNAAEAYAIKKQGSLVWCNARTGAVGFYLKNGYQLIGDEFNIVGVGPHFRMNKLI